MNDHIDTPTLAPAESTDPAFRLVGDPGPLFGALAKAHAAFAPINKNRTVTVRPKDGSPYTFDYATLDQVFAATMPALSANGLALLQPFYHGPDGPELRTILAHDSGARLEVVSLLPKYEKIQALGSSLTYLKRYQVQCILGVSSEEDDDGNAADGNQVQASGPRGKPAEPPKRQAPAKPPSKPQERPASVQAPEPQVGPQSSPEPNPEPAPARSGVTPEQLARFGKLLKDPARKWSGAQVGDLLRGLFNKTHQELTADEGEQAIRILEVGAKLGYQPDVFLEQVGQYSTAEAPDAGAVLRAFEAEDSVLGGAS